MIRNTLALAGIAALLTLSGCASNQPPDAPVTTGFLSTYRNLEQQSPTSWSYINPNNRLARYNSFIVDPVILSLPDGAKAWDMKAGDLKAVTEYMRTTLIETISTKFAVTDTPGGETGRIKVAMTDAFDASGRIGIAMEGEILDSVSNVQVAALVESAKGNNLTINRFWQESDATKIMDGWATRALAVIEQAHANVGN